MALALEPLVSHLKEGDFSPRHPSQSLLLILFSRLCVGG